MMLVQRVEFLVELLDCLKLALFLWWYASVRHTGTILWWYASVWHTGTIFFISRFTNVEISWRLFWFWCAELWVPPPTLFFFYKQNTAWDYFVCLLVCADFFPKSCSCSSLLASNLSSIICPTEIGQKSDNYCSQSTDFALPLCHNSTNPWSLQHCLLGSVKNS